MTTQVEQYKQREQANRMSLKHWLKMDDEAMNEMIFDGAYEYLEKVFGSDEYGIEFLPQTAEFWTWWRMEWNRIDQIFIDAVSPRHSVENPQWYCVLRDRDKDDVMQAVHNVSHLMKWYIKYHEASMSNRYVNSSVVRAGAHDMINAIIGGKTKQTVNHG